MEGLYTVEEFDNPLTVNALIESLTLVQRKQGARRKKGEKEILDIVCAYDCETSTFYRYDPELEKEKPHSFVYIWQYQLGPDHTIIGRTFEEFQRFMDILKDISRGVARKSKYPGMPLFVTYVHNLAFDWTFLQGFFNFENEDCFFRDIRKPIYCRLQHIIEFRCSYLHSNMSLAKFAENMGCKVRKLDGFIYDYKKLRFPWTPLSDYELQYCINDVRTLEEAIRTEMLRDRDTLKSIPLTSTGYVRRDCREAIKPIHFSIEQMLPDLECYQLLRRCFRGGDTHANRFRVSVIQEDCHGLDIESSYPTQQLTKRFPMGPFHKLALNENTLERIMKLIGKGNAVIADYQFKNLRLKNWREPFPYIPLAKCHAYHPILDNGRVLSADMIIMGLTEIDLEIILGQYDFDQLRIYNAYTAVKGPLPKCYRDVILKYYSNKTSLKKVPGREYEYMKSKNKLNGIYGMSAQDPCHSIIVYSKGEFLQYSPEDEIKEKELSKAPFPYQWGVYTTAYARKALRDGLALVPEDENGISRAIYCDTDSIKYTGPVLNFENLNRKLRAAAKEAGATATDKKGNLHYIGIWDFDGDYRRFVTHGAKRYCYEDDNGELHITVSGVTKKPHNYYNADGSIEKTTLYAAEELGSIENFKQGMIWHEAGGTAAVYNDEDDFDFEDPETGRKMHITPNVSIVDTTYTLSYEQDYEKLISDCIHWVKFLKEKGRTQK